jgi:hypothetical protein
MALSTNQMINAPSCNTGGTTAGTVTGVVIGTGGSGGGVTFTDPYARRFAEYPEPDRRPDYNVAFRFVDDHVIATLTSKDKPYEFIELVGENLEEIMKKITARMVANRISQPGKQEV